MTGRFIDLIADDGSRTLINPKFLNYVLPKEGNDFSSGARIIFSTLEEPCLSMLCIAPNQVAALLKSLKQGEQSSIFVETIDVDGDLLIINSDVISHIRLNQKSCTGTTSSVSVIGCGIEVPPNESLKLAALLT